MLQNTLIKNYFDSSLKLSDLVDNLETTDRPTARAIVVVQRTDVAIVIEAVAVRKVAERRRRPITTGVTYCAEIAITAATITRSRIPDRRCTTEPAGEVYAFVGAVIE